MKLKSLIAALAIALAPMQSARSQLGPAVFCISITAVVVAGGVAVYLYTCKPRYYCVQDNNDTVSTRWCRPLANLREARILDLKIIGGPYNDIAQCESRCTTNNAAMDFGPLATIRVERSYDLVHWETCIVTNANPEAFEYAETNTTARSCFYRATY